MLLNAFDSFPEAAYLFGEDLRLTRANRAAAELEDGGLALGKSCCQMFWHDEGAEGCVVDRALRTAQKVTVEVLAGAHGSRPISITVEPLKMENGGRFAFVVARDISDLRSAEAEALSHKSFLASIADRTPDEIYALDVTGRITWMNERAEAYKLPMSPLVTILMSLLKILKKSPSKTWPEHSPVMTANVKWC